MNWRAALLSGVALAVSASAQARSAPADDPYIWLEQVSSPRSLAWVEQENARTIGLFEKDPRYAGLYADALRIAEATDRIPMPDLVGGAVLNFWQDGAHVRGLWRRTSIAGYRDAAPKWQTLIDLDALSAAEKGNWVWKGATCEPAAEQNCLVALSDGGEDATTDREFDLQAATFRQGGFTLPTSKQDAAWENADSLLVARDWGPGTMTSSGYAFVVKRLTRGQPLSAATEVFRGKPSDVGVSPVSFADGRGTRVSLILRGVTFFESETYLVTPKGVVRLAVPAKSQPAGLVDGRLIFQVNEAWTLPGQPPIGAGAIVAIDLAGARGGSVGRPSVLFTPNARQSVEEVEVTRSRVLASIYDNVRGRAYSFTPSGQGWTAARLPLPDNASVDIAAGDRGSDQAFLRVQSFLEPTTLWLADVGRGTTEQVKSTPARFDAAGLVTEQFEAASSDGTKIPYFVVHRQGMAMDGSTPTIMTAYGGFQASETPTYLATRGKLWLERGGAFVLANIRGGGEFGPAWHEAGLKTKRQLIYDDFAAVARDLIRRKITSPRRFGIYGGSNGGLLMGVEMIQHPELWNAVAIQVPLLDMMRYEQIAAGASWVGEYGSVSVPAERAFLAGISPYANLRRGAKYPEPFIWTTTKDDRVGPVHARKFAARMKEYGLPYYYWENTEGGHSAGANLKQASRAQALETTYFIRKLMDPEEPR